MAAEARAVSDTATCALQDALRSWLQGLNEDAIVYDGSWGGLVSSDGIADKAADFGNGWYNVSLRALSL